MRPGFLAPYELALASGGGEVGMRAADGRSIEFDVPRWLGAADAADDTVLARCRGPVLDIGCGPGRLVEALLDRGVSALGIDIAPGAVQISRRRGARVLECDVFGWVPHAGTWQTALLMDGNVGINGDVGALLHRVGELLAPGGQLICEATGSPGQDEVVQAEFVIDSRPVGAAFGWAVVDEAGLRRRAELAGYSMLDRWSCGARTFVQLVRLPESNAEIR